MKAQLSEAAAVDYELVYKGNDTIHIVGVGRITFSSLSPATCAQLEKILDGDNNPLYVKKKVLKSSPKATSEGK